MKHVLALALCAGSFSAYAQQCWFTSDAMYGHEIYYGGGYVRDDGSILSRSGTLMGGWASHSALWSSDGQVLWNKYFKHMSQTKRMEPTGFGRTAGGGATFAGVLYHEYSYTNLYGAVIDANGDPVWARYYMMDSVITWNMYGNLAQTADGDLLYVVQTNIGLVISKLDVNGIPQWTKRYSAGYMGAQDDAYHKGYVIPEDNGELTIFGWKKSVMYMVRTDDQGNVLWHKKYPGSVGLGTRTVNGDYLCSGNSGSPDYTPYVTRLDHDGNVLWQRSGVAGALIELGNGHILVTASGYLITYLTELDADGSFIQRWTAPMQEWPEYAPALRFIGSDGPRGDSLAMGVDGYYEGPIAPAIISASSTASLDCFGFTTAAAITTTLVTSPVEIADDTLTVVPDILKTWTMLIGPTVDANAFDPAAHLVGNFPVPGFEGTVYGRITNNGHHSTGPVTATLTFDPALSYVSATPAPTSVVGQTVTWNLPALTSRSQRLVNMTFSTPADVGLLGTDMDFTLSFVQDSAELSLANNTATYATTVLGSYDPNDKHVTPADYYHIQTDSTLEYTIRFQNTGTAPAQTVVVRDTLPASVDVRTFELLVTSHACTYAISGDGLLVFTFNNINLPDSNANEPGSHGLVSFRVKPLQPLMLGQVITNRANIYFDFNPPILTNDASVTVTDATTVVAPARPGQLALFPVPVKQTVTAMLPPGFAPATAFVIAVDGRRIAVPSAGNNTLRVEYDVQHLPAGAYVLLLTDRSGNRLSARFTKE
jgi:uncharacterized repeat protein (TIGR01451 family)